MPGKSSTLSEVKAVRLRTELWVRVRAWAQEEGLSRNAWIRRAVLDAGRLQDSLKERALREAE